MATVNTARLWRGGAAPTRELAASDIAEAGHLVALQRKVAAVLRAFTPLAPIQMQNLPGAITYEDAATIRRDVERSLATAGISLVVGIRSGARRSDAPHACHLAPVTFTVSIGEGTAANRSARGSGITCTRAAELVILALSGLPLANGVCAFAGFTSFGTDEDGLQTAVLAFETDITLSLPEAYTTP